MLAKLGCSYAVVGHSERRQYHAEDDAVVNAKAKAALAADITPILCIGEGLEVRKAATTSGTASPSWTAGWRRSPPTRCGAP